MKFARACYSVLEATDVLLFDWGFFLFASVFVKHLLGTMYSSNSFTLLFRVLSGQCGELWQPINAVHGRDIESWGQTGFTNKNLRSWTHTTLISELFPIGGIRKDLCVCVCGEFKVIQLVWNTAQYRHVISQMGYNSRLSFGPGESWLSPGAFVPIDIHSR